jgi:hypothetical protein
MEMIPKVFPPVRTQGARPQAGFPAAGGEERQIQQARASRTGEIALPTDVGPRHDAN